LIVSSFLNSDAKMGALSDGVPTEKTPFWDNNQEEENHQRGVRKVFEQDSLPLISNLLPRWLGVLGCFLFFFPLAGCLHEISRPLLLSACLVAYSLGFGE